MNKEDAVETLKGMLDELGRLVKSVEETGSGDLDVLGVNGRTVHLAVGTMAVGVRSYESGGDEILSGRDLVMTKKEGWEDRVMATVKKVLKGREAAIAERVAASAEEEYRVKRREVSGLVKELESKLDRHEMRQSKKPQDWGFAGDMAHVAEELEALVKFMG